MRNEPIDFAPVAHELLKALERRHAGRKAEQLPRVLPALVIARRFNIRPGGTDDSRKRGVRRVVDFLRVEGVQVLANFKGYYLGGTAEDLRRYEEFRRRMGLAHLVAASDTHRSEVHDDAAGQLRLGGTR